MDILKKQRQMKDNDDTFILYVLLNLIEQLQIAEVIPREYDNLPTDTPSFRNWYQVESQLKQMIQKISEKY